MSTATPVKYDENAKTHTPFSSGDTFPPSSIPVSRAANNLVQVRDDGLFVALEAPVNVQEQYVSSVSGNDGNAGTQDAPLQSIRKAIARLPDSTAGAIFLKAGETFALEDGSGLSGSPSLADILGAIIDLGRRSISIYVYGDAEYTRINNIPGAVVGKYSGIAWPTITCGAYDAGGGSVVCPGLSIAAGGSLAVQGHRLQVTNKSSVSSPASATYCSLISVNSGGSFSGMNPQLLLSTFPMFGGPGNTSGSITFNGALVDTSGGRSLCDAHGYSLQAPFSDTSAGQDANGTVLGSNWNTTCNTTASFPGVVILSEEARTYQGLLTTNKIVAA